MSSVTIAHVISICTRCDKKARSMYNRTLSGLICIDDKQDSEGSKAPLCGNFSFAGAARPATCLPPPPLDSDC
eukprot:scaffold114682_cov19-Tisochrysis_lutea.AAC.1